MNLRTNHKPSLGIFNLEIRKVSLSSQWSNLARCWTSLVAQMVKNLPAMQETWVRPLGWEDLLEKEMVTHSSILAWRIPWTEEPGGLQPMGLQRVRHDWVTNTHMVLIATLSTCVLAQPKRLTCRCVGNVFFWTLVFCFVFFFLPEHTLKTSLYLLKPTIYTHLHKDSENPISHPRSEHQEIKGTSPSWSKF